MKPTERIESGIWYLRNEQTGKADIRHPRKVTRGRYGLIDTKSLDGRKWSRRLNDEQFHELYVRGEKGEE